MELTVNPRKRTQLMTTAFFVAYACINLTLAAFGTATA